MRLYYCLAFLFVSPPSSPLFILDTTSFVFKGSFYLMQCAQVIFWGFSLVGFKSRCFKLYNQFFKWPRGWTNNLGGWTNVFQMWSYCLAITESGFEPFKWQAVCRSPFLQVSIKAIFRRAHLSATMQNLCAAERPGLQALCQLVCPAVQKTETNPPNQAWA